METSSVSPNITMEAEAEKMQELNEIEGLTVCDQNVVEREILRHMNEACNENLEEGELSGEEKEPPKLENAPIMFVSDTINETESERKVRLGEMTPFGSVLHHNSNTLSPLDKNSSVSRYLKQQEELQKKFKNEKKTHVKQTHHKHVLPSPKKRRKKIKLGTETVEECYSKSGPLLSERMTVDFEEASGSEYCPSDDEICSSDNDDELKKETRRGRKRKEVFKISGDEMSDDSDTTCASSGKHIVHKVVKELDDGNEIEYQNRLKAYEKSFDTTEMIFYEFDHCNFKIPLQTWSKLYNYQKVGVQWLWELHQQEVGGILGDEMGLGKTIQVISFLSGIYYSKLKNKHLPYRGLGPSLIICPTTLMHQWVKEFHQWLPPVRIAVLHASGSYSGERKKLIREVFKSRGIVITSYVSMVQYSEEILRYDWHFVILDEGHKIRNPDAKITLTMKQLKTPHRLILSGSPLQNNLEELWSLFDFIYPGKLGSLPMFQSQFAVPITHGGYANASDVEVTIAYKCATVLKELIAPYLLRRAKMDVKSHINLPEKNEQVLFCQLTEEQRSIYRSYLDSGEIHRILDGQMQIFVGLINLRKICNHPDLFSGGPKLLVGQTEDHLLEEERFGFWKKSGKMIVLETLLKIWHKQGHKVLLFSQSKKMLDILELFLQSCNYSFLKMDGTTSIASRQPLITKFNTDPNYFIMLLTTKVGGLGVNLTGANRIIIFDPDWNPATDTQARERAWRIGQKQDVTIYRFITVGTIEEKMYHRQIFKQFLTNKVLKDPKQRRFFKSNDLFELFTLKESDQKGSTETGAIFAGTGSEINLNHLNVKKKKSKRQSIPEIHFSKSKIEKMKLIAQRLSQKIVQQAAAVSKKSDDNINADKNETPQPSTSSSSQLETTKEENRLELNSMSDHTEKQSPSDQDSGKFILNDTSCLKTEEQNSPKKKKKRKKHLFEGEYVPYLVKSKTAKHQEEEETEVKAEDDEYVLKKLFTKSGVCSALQHDTIMEGGPPDFALVEKEAEKIAQEAINELKKSQEACFSARTGIPNWTGKHGKKQSGSKLLSSNDILDKIKKRNGTVAATKSETQVLIDLKNYLSNAGGTASTDALIKNFQSTLPVSMTPLFKSLLNKVCTFYRAPDKKGYWSLKPEFQ